MLAPTPRASRAMHCPPPSTELTPILSQIWGDSLCQEGGQAAVHGRRVHVAVAGGEEQGGLGLLVEDLLAGRLERLLHLLAGVGVLQLHAAAQREAGSNPTRARPWLGWGTGDTVQGPT